MKKLTPLLIAAIFLSQIVLIDSAKAANHFSSKRIGKTPPRTSYNQEGQKQNTDKMSFLMRSATKIIREDQTKRGQLDEHKKELNPRVKISDNLNEDDLLSDDINEDASSDKQNPNVIYVIRNFNPLHENIVV